MGDYLLFRSLADGERSGSGLGDVLVLDSLGCLAVLLRHLDGGGALMAIPAAPGGGEEQYEVRGATRQAGGDVERIDDGVVVPLAMVEVNEDDMGSACLYSGDPCGALAFHEEGWLPCVADVAALLDGTATGESSAGFATAEDVASSVGRGTKRGRGRGSPGRGAPAPKRAVPQAAFQQEVRAEMAELRELIRSLQAPTPAPQLPIDEGTGGGSAPGAASSGPFGIGAGGCYGGLALGGGPPVGLSAVPRPVAAGPRGPCGSAWASGSGVGGLDLGGGGVVGAGGIPPVFGGAALGGGLGDSVEAEARRLAAGGGGFLGASGAARARGIGAGAVGAPVPGHLGGGAGVGGAAPAAAPMVGAALPAQGALAEAIARRAQVLRGQGSPNAGFGADESLFASPEAMLDPAMTGMTGGGIRMSGQAQLAKLLRTRRSHPEAYVAAYEQVVTEKMHILPGHAWSYHQFYMTEVEPFCGHFVTLKRLGALVAGAMDEGRSGSLARQHAYLASALALIEGAAKAADHDLSWGWPLLGVRDPGGAAEPTWPVASTAAVSAYHRERVALEEARKKVGVGRGAGGAAGSSGSDGSQANLPSMIRAAVKEEIQGKGGGGRGRGNPAAAGRGDGTKEER